jgi:hypothetical protein
MDGPELLRGGWPVLPPPTNAGALPFSRSVRKGGLFNSPSGCQKLPSAPQRSRQQFMLFLRKRIGYRDPVPGESFLQIFRPKQLASRHRGGGEDYRVPEAEPMAGGQIGRGGAGPHVVTKAAPLVAGFDEWALRTLICWSL